jgi:hypothetical protein
MVKLQSVLGPRANEAHDSGHAGTASLEAEVARYKADIARYREELERLKAIQAVEAEVARDRPARGGEPRFEDLALPIPEKWRSWLDRSDVDESKLDEDQLFYRRNGYLIKEGLIPDELTSTYLADRLAVDDPNYSLWGGSYMGLESMRDVCLYEPLVDIVEKLVGKPVALFLTLSGLQSTRRSWHQDFYLKPGYENVDYSAVWIAVGDVDPDSGPYEYVPETHKLPTLRRELVYEWLTPEERNSPVAHKTSERFVEVACERLFEERNLQRRTFLPKRGDVLIWHHSLLHQGSKPNVPGMFRPGLIAHYNAVDRLWTHRNNVVTAPNGKKYAHRDDFERVVKNRVAAQDLVVKAAALRST